MVALIAALLVFLMGIFSLEKSIPAPTPTPAIQIIIASPTPTPIDSPKPSAKAVTPTPTPKPSSAPSTGGKVHTEKGDFSATVLTFDMGSTKMITDTAGDSDCADNCPTLSLADYVARNGGYAGINGTYFCPATYPECTGKSNSFDFPVYVTRLSKWAQADKLGWGNRRAVVYTDGSGAHYLNSSAGFGGGLNAGIINYPGLLDGGNVQIDDNQSGLSDKQRSVGTKEGIGVKNNNTLLVVVAYSVNMQQFAYVFKALGATGALNLDTGGSTALYNNGHYVLGPGRGLPNAIIFVRK